MVYQNYGTRNLTTNCPSLYLKLPGINKKHPLHPKLQTMTLLISNQYHSENQIHQMHNYLYRQRGKTPQNQNATVHLKDGSIFVVNGVLIHC